MKTAIKLLFAVWITAGLSACAWGGKPAVMLRHYALEYAPPSLQGLTQIDQAIAIERFSIAQVFNHVKMLYRPQPGLYNEYAYHRWRVNPADMLGDLLLRDLRAAGVFRTVFSYRDQENAALRLRGDVSEFFEREGADGRKAVLAIHVTLMDNTQKDPSVRVIFQKTYRHEEPFTDETVQGFAGGMSRAARMLSGQIIRDVHAAIRK